MTLLLLSGMFRYVLCRIAKRNTITDPNKATQIQRMTKNTLKIREMLKIFAYS